MLFLTSPMIIATCSYIVTVTLHVDRYMYRMKHHSYVDALKTTQLL